MSVYNFRKIGVNKFQLEKVAGMKAEVVVYATERILEEAKNDLACDQLVEAASMRGVVSPVIGMPDMHQGFGLPIGGVLATEGIISCGSVGMDINCGVRLLLSNLVYNDNDFAKGKLFGLINQIERLIPVGLGQKHKQRVEINLRKLVEQGVKYLVKDGYAYRADLEVIEEGGCLEGAEWAALSEKAIKRSVRQVGTLGSGNHFIEIQKVDKVYDQERAEVFGIKEGQIGVMVHSGSRALGHQTCVDYTNLFWKVKDKYGMDIPRKGLAAVPIETTEGQRYFGAMAASVNFAFCNRQMMTYFLRQVFKKRFGVELTLLYDVAHNIAKWEEHGGKRLLIHRKGATRALPPGHSRNPRKYQDSGHPAIVPGSMGTASYVVVGLEANKETYYSINHGAGRVMSRGQAKRTIKKEDFDKIMENIAYNKPFRVIADEAPGAYKNIEEVVDTLVEAGLTAKVARLVPLAVIKGS